MARWPVTPEEKPGRWIVTQIQRKKFGEAFRCDAVFCQHTKRFSYLRDGYDCSSSPSLQDRWSFNRELLEVRPVSKDSKFLRASVRSENSFPGYLIA